MRAVGLAAARRFIWRRPRARARALVAARPSRVPRLGPSDFDR
jgi:hypothetical protein